MVIQRVAPGGPADKAGIKRDDILLAVGHKPIKNYGDLVEASNASGGKMSLKLLRGGKTIIVAVTLLGGTLSDTFHTIQCNVSGGGSKWVADAAAAGGGACAK